MKRHILFAAKCVVAFAITLSGALIAVNINRKMDSNENISTAEENRQYFPPSEHGRDFEFVDIASDSYGNCYRIRPGSRYPEHLSGVR